MSKFICLLISSLLVLPITVEAQKYQNIVRDYRNDAGGDPENPFRLVLIDALSILSLESVFHSLQSLH